MYWYNVTGSQDTAFKQHSIQAQDSNIWSSRILILKKRYYYTGKICKATMQRCHYRKYGNRNDPGTSHFMKNSESNGWAYAVTFMNTLPRIYFPYLSGTINYHLCVFADASTKAYGAIAHPCSDNNISFVMFKGRVAPIKSLNLPKLELMTAVTATRVAKFVQSSFSANQHLLLVHPWMDSQIVLHWINNGSHSNSFVHQWVTETLKNFSSRCWSFTLSANNPADLLTRGISTEQLKSSELWIHGPHWLLNTSNWPTWTPINIFDVVVSRLLNLYSPQPMLYSKSEQTYWQLLMLHTTVSLIVQ